MVSFRTLLPLLAALPINAVTVRITPLGDSLTGGPGCWRALLWQKLQAAGVTNTDFVGTGSAGGCGITFDGEHEGHGGFKATGIVTDNQLPGWLAYSQPDMVMMMLGTNDVWNGLPTAQIITALSTLVDQMRASKPTMRILVAKIPPMNPGGCTACDWPGAAKALGDAIAVWAPTKSTASSQITVVDCWTGFVAADFSDGVHMTDSGTAKLAECWYEPVKSAILAYGGTNPTSPPVTSTTTRAVPSSTTTVRPSSSSVVQTTSMRTSAVATTSVRPTTTRTTTTLLTTTRAVTTSAGQSGGAPLWGQCGGTGWTGPTTCAQGTCKISNEWYSQCL